jgi:hypothetical protein
MPGGNQVHRHRRAHLAKTKKSNLHEETPLQFSLITAKPK